MRSQKTRIEILWAEFDRDQERGTMNCEYCKREMHNRHLSFDGLRKTRDHYIPLSRGGTNAKENIRYACHRCNGLKGNMMPDEWEAYMAAVPMWWTFTRWQRRYRALGNPPLPLEESVMILRFGKKAWKEWKARQAVVTPVYTLDALFEGMTEENVHGEVRPTSAVGNEFPNQEGRA